MQLFAIAFTLLATLSDVRSEVAQQVDARLREAEGNGFSGVIVIRDPQGDMLRKAYGPGSCDRTLPLALEYRFDIGSITKVFTAVAVLRAAQDGVLSLNETLHDIFGDVPADKRAITISQLLTHASGLPESIGDDETLIRRDFYVRRALAAPLQKPGYSNTGYSLLAAILEKRTGRPYEAYLREKVLAPGGATAIGYANPADAKMACGFREGLAWGYTSDYFGTFGPSWNLVGNGALMASIAELDRWFDALFAGKLLNQDGTALVVERLSRKDAAGRPVFLVSGSNLIFTAHYQRRPDSGVVLILFTSTDNWPKEKIIPLLREPMAMLAK